LEFIVLDRRFVADNVDLVAANCRARGSAATSRSSPPWIGSAASSRPTSIGSTSRPAR
jgi:hypothetical protein